MNKLQEIIAQKHVEVDRLKPRAEHLRLAAMSRNDFRSLHAALLLGEDCLGVIAEVKRASPSAGIIKEDFDPVAQAVAYDRAGATAISVLTDERFFHGHLGHLAQIRPQVGCPLLRKDFIIDEVQIYESVVAGADAILLIVAALEQDQLHHLLQTATACQLDVLMEVHDREELDRALETDAKIIGVNNRNLKTFAVDLHTTELLSEEVPDGIILVSESGIRTPADARRTWGWGANAVLVGEALMRASDPAEIIQAFLDAPAADG
ncbi:MAG: indole-3-glycerol phosphate synthase TrpC [Verrucomicrobiales bacterium]|nr:indole-3-glycerol phosphate synthase TrpC [Verrucomicrobiales bacterium]